MQMIQFVARRDILILGKLYNVGDVVDDPEIPPRVLSSLTNTRKIAQRIIKAPAPAAPEKAPEAVTQAPWEAASKAPAEQVPWKVPEKKA